MNVIIYNPSRADVMSVHCPDCGAKPFAHCVGVRGKIRKSNHLERVHRYIGQLSSSNGSMGT